MTSKGYFQTVIIGTTLLIGTVGLIVLHSATRSDLNYSYIKLVKYQKNKLNRSGELDIVLVGDSSLGNAIDAETWSALLDRNVVSLALTGNFGFGGDYSFARQAIEQGASTIVVMHAFDIFDKDRILTQDYKGYLYTAQSLTDLLSGDIPVQTFCEFVFDKSHIRQAVTSTLKQVYSLLSGSARKELPDDEFEAIAANDYWPQDKKRDYISYEGNRDPGGINPNKLKYLTKLQALCADNDVSCVYMHGPVYKSYCANSAPYISNVNMLITASGMTLLTDMPLCMENEQTGDSRDHATPDFKHVTTNYYLDILNQHNIHSLQINDY